MVFVLSYSRLLYVAASLRPIDTAALIRMHDAAFRSFGGFPQECVYDQTRLVVSAETFRELALNERFARYATTVGFRIRACEGDDPESKGKVEAGVKYVKQDALYGETFADFPALEVYVAQWFDETANVRLPAATGEAPRVRFERDERTALAYFSPRGIAELAVCRTFPQPNGAGRDTIVPTGPRTCTDDQLPTDQPRLRLPAATLGPGLVARGASGALHRRGGRRAGPE